MTGGAICIRRQMAGTAHSRLVTDHHQLARLADNDMSSPESELLAQSVYPPHVLHNTNALYNIKFLTSCFVGAVCGILGLENYQGFALLVVWTAVTSGVVYVVRCRGEADKYIRGGLWELVNPGQDNLFSFVLLWTLFYGKGYFLDSSRE